MHDAAARQAVVIGGPTASGKSALALAVAEALDGVVINADSMQVYRELRILTARPGPADEARVPHRLYGVLAARQACSAALWAGLAQGEIAAARAAGRLPVVVGGSGLYLRTLMCGIAPVPAIPAAVRAGVRARCRAAGAPALHGELARRDPATAARLRPTDSQRVMRALEVLEATGVPLADWQRRRPAPPAAGVRAVILLPPRAALGVACEARLRAMAAAGALDEVRRLLALGLAPGTPVLGALGVAAFGRHLAGACSLDQALADAGRATRRYARRQETWFRRQPPAGTPGAVVVTEQFSDSLATKIITKLS